jgi:hypothetical protein
MEMTVARVARVNLVGETVNPAVVARVATPNPVVVTPTSVMETRFGRGQRRDVHLPIE